MSSRGGEEVTRGTATCPRTGDEHARPKAMRSDGDTTRGIRTTRRGGRGQQRGRRRCTGVHCARRRRWFNEEADEGGNGPRHTATMRLSWLTSLDEPEPAGAVPLWPTVARPPIWLALPMVTTDNACSGRLVGAKFCLQRSPSKAH